MEKGKLVTLKVITTKHLIVRNEEDPKDWLTIRESEIMDTEEKGNFYENSLEIFEEITKLSKECQQFNSMEISLAKNDISVITLLRKIVTV